MSVSIVLSYAQARRQIRAAHLETWLAGGSVKFYAAPRAATPDTAIAGQALLVTFPLPTPPGSASDGVFAFAAADPALVVADGTAAWARFFDAGGAAVLDCDVGVTGSGAALELDNLILVAGGRLYLSGITFTEV